MYVCALYRLCIQIADTCTLTARVEMPVHIEPHIMYSEAIIIIIQHKYVTIRQNKSYSHSIQVNTKL